MDKCPTCGLELQSKQIEEDPEPWWTCQNDHGWRRRPDGQLVPLES